VFGGVQGFAGDGGLATNAELAIPTGVALDSAGNIYIADSANSRIRKIAQWADHYRSG
jgi:DNA-binding beta-propeller fold protein YncE